jgi:hypothetical protein
MYELSDIEKKAFEHARQRAIVEFYRKLDEPMEKQQRRAGYDFPLSLIDRVVADVLGGLEYHVARLVDWVLNRLKRW